MSSPQVLRTEDMGRHTQQRQTFKKHIYFYVYECFDCMYVIMAMPGTGAVRKKVLGPLGLDFQVVVSCSVGDGD